MITTTACMYAWMVDAKNTGTNSFFVFVLNLLINTGFNIIA